MVKKGFDWNIIYKIAAIIIIIAALLWIISLIWGPTISGNVAASCLGACYDIKQECPTTDCYDRTGNPIQCQCDKYFGECLDKCYPGATKITNTAK